MQQKTEKVIALLKAYLGTLPLRTEMLPASGSQRQYYRLYTSEGSFIGVYHTDMLENRLFIDFSRHFRAKGLPVPEVFAVSDDGLVYLQEDLGEVMLLDFVGQHWKGNMLDETALSLYKKVLLELLRFQFLGGEGLDYSHFQYDMCTEGRRQIGSTIKPFLYALAMENAFARECSPLWKGAAMDDKELFTAASWSRLAFKANPDLVSI